MHNRITILSFCLFLFAGVCMAQSASGDTKDDIFNTLDQENKIDIYPNPAVEYLIVQISSSDLENAEFEMHSIIGNKMSIDVRELGNGKYRIPVESFSTGYYFLVVKDEETRFKKAYKFLKD